MFTYIAHAASPGAAEAASFVARFNEVILFPIIGLLIGVALLVFMYGSFIYITNANNPVARETGQKHILWSVIGLFVMLTALAILGLAANTFGLGRELDCADNPSDPNCANVFRAPGGGGAPGGGIPGEGAPGGGIPGDGAPGGGIGGNGAPGGGID